MYLMINGNQHTCGQRIVSSDTVMFLSVSPAPEEISGMIEMYRNDGFLMSSDNADDYERKFHEGALLTLTNKPEPTVTPNTDNEPSADEVLDALLGVTE